MSTHLLAQASQLAQAGIAVFPTGADKRPAIKGWRQAATTDPAQLAEWFSGRFAGIGVPCGPDQDLICFDVDLGHTDDAARIEKLQDWLSEWANVKDDGYVLRKTRSGGYHLLFGWPHEAKTKVPRRIMPKMDVIIEGFYFVWDTEAGDYTHVRGEFDDMVEAPAAMCKVIESSTGGDGSSMMSAEEAHEVMMSDGDAGMRHDALLRMTHDWAHDFPDMKKAEAIRLFEEQFRDYYGDCLDPDRLDEMFAGETSEVARAMVGAYKRAPVGDDLLERAAEKLRAKGRLSVAGAVQVKQAEARAEKQEQAMSAIRTVTVDEVVATELQDVDWIIEDVIPSRNLIGLAGPSGAGKTRVLIALLAALSSAQTEKLGLPPAKRKIRSLYVANEERFEDLDRRLKAASVANGISGTELIAFRAKDSGQCKLVDAEGNRTADFDVLEEYIIKNNVELVAFDPFVTLGVEEENSAAGVDGVMSALQALTRRCAVLFVHHTPKDRTLAEDEYRGDPAAFRGHGSIYSALDIALTVFPYLPPSCHGKDTKGNRRKMAQMKRDKRVPKFIVMDSAKERESEGFPSVYFRLDGQPVREGGKPIGAPVRVHEQEAEGVYEGALKAMPDGAIDRRKHMAWAEAMLAAYPRTTGLSLQQLVDVLDKAEPVGWTKGKDRARKNEGRGAELLGVLCQPLTLNGSSVRIVESPKRGFIWKVQ